MKEAIRRKRKQLGCLPRSKYDIIVRCLNGSFDVPVKKRTPEENNCLAMIRKRKDFELGDRGSLLCGGKQVLVKEDLPRFVEKMFMENKGCGARVIYNKLKVNYTGFSEQAILEILYNSKYYHEKYPRFTNKPKPKTITEEEPGKRWQIDIINMKNQSVSYKGSTYSYILQVVDVYSRYVMPKPLKTKSSREVAKALEDVLMVNLAPDIIQCDNGLEFKGPSMKLLLNKYNIKMINSRPYHPQSQGKCERSNSVIKAKILFATKSKRGFNWVEGLQDLAYAINTSFKRVLGGLTPFEAYYGRSHVFTKERHSSREIKKTIRRANKKAYRSLLKNATSPSKYKVGETVLIRYPFRKSRVPTKRYVIEGKVEKVKRNGVYIVSFQVPNKPELGFVSKSVGVENMTSLTVALEKQRKIKKHSLKQNRSEKQITELSTIMF
ncbi:hypothetical protein DPMN_161081 [Dreissena polymorpha]|uniref:Integrase catalytic domain-containing protein n=1 Tax=Dreissena polymorpha TaxID=45954 RepID=A0A9D4IT53_DREPO|nr:hypothetical protein DPMN_161081 [Dreissena polymorpha]